MIIGIDPGKNGAAVILSDDGIVLDEIRFSKNTWYDVIAKLRIDISKTKEKINVIIERVSAMPGQGVSSMFNFGKNVGTIDGIFISLGFPIRYVTPQKWQLRMNCRTKGDKNVTKLAAQKLFPKRKIVHGNADAYLIAEYGRIFLK